MPGNDEYLCDSRTWWPKIKEIAEKFETRLNEIENKDSVFVQLNVGNLNLAFEMYEQSWHRFKVHTYGPKAKEEHIDRHKIISLYILSFLAKEPFLVSITKSKEADRHLHLANELFSLEVMLELIFLWNKNNKIFEIGENEKRWLITLFNNIRIKLTESNPPVISDKLDRLVDFLSLAQIIYYIEKSYM
jgi:hypothetical protein